MRKVTVDVTREDYWKFNLFGLMTVRALRRTLIFNMSAMPVLSFIVLLIFGIAKDIPIFISLVLAIIIGALLDLLILYITKMRIMKMPEKKSGILGEHTIIIDEKGIDETSVIGDVSYIWTSISSIEQNKDYIFIFVSNLSGHIIPKRYFASEEEANEFYQLAMKYWKGETEQ